MPPSQVALTFQQVRDLWISAGGPTGGVENVMAGIAMVESNGYPNAHLQCPQMGSSRCPVGDVEDSRGLWQINILAHPQFSNWNLYNPATAAQAAVNLYKADGFGPWLPDITSGKIFPKIPAGAVLPPGIKGTPSGNGSGGTSDVSLVGTICKLECCYVPFPCGGGIEACAFSPICISCKAAQGKPPTSGIPGIPGVPSLNSILGTVGAKIAYAGIIVAGGVLIILGLAMMGLDIGMGRKSSINVITNNTPGKRRARAQAESDKQAASDSRERRANANAITRRRKEERLAAERAEKKKRNPGSAQGRIHPETGDDIPF